MLYTEAQKAIAFKLGRRTDLQAEIISEIDAQQRELETEANLPWFLVSDIVIPHTDVNGLVNPVPLPAAFIREYEDAEWYASMDSGELVPLEKISDRHAARGGSGFPQAYFLFGDTVEYFPSPDKNYLLSVRAYVKEPLLSEQFIIDGNLTTNKWLAHAPQVLIEAVVVSLCSTLRDVDGARLAAERLQVAKQKMREQTVYRMEYNQLRTMGERN